MNRGILALTLACLPASALAQTMPVPESIHAEGVPAIPKSVTQALGRYQHIRAASFQDWDDTKDRAMYITTRFAETNQAHHVASPGAARRQLTFGSERVLIVKPRPGHEQFLFAMDEGGAENYQLFLQDRAGGEPRRITDGKSRNISPTWSPSGELLAWSSNGRNGRDMDLYVAAPADAHFVRRLKEVSGQWTVADWSPDETKVVAVEYLSASESYVHIIEIADGKTTSITPRRASAQAEPVSASMPRWSPDGRAIYYLSDKGSEFRRLVRHELATGAETALTKSIPWDIEEYEVSDDGKVVAVVANVDGSDALYSSFPGDSHFWGDRVPPGRISGLKFRKETYELGFTRSTAQESADACSFTLMAKEPHIDRWTESETGGLDTLTFPDPKLIRYQTFDDREIPAFVYRPPAARFPGRRPVLIDIHGGPEAQFRPGFMGRLNYLINELGLVLIMPNVRGSSGYGKSHLKLDDAMLREGAVKDIGALLEWIGQQADLDKTRVGVMGGSYGGFMSLAVQTTYNERIKAGIDIVGISNFVTFLKNTQDYRRDLRRAEYGDERDPKVHDFLQRISPLSSVEKIKTPILIVQGQNDPRVPLSEAEQVLAGVKRNGVPVWYVVGKNEGHGFARKVNQDYLQAVEVLFLRQYLLGESSKP
jgi:dipeptidyl aminopeptidase/acylaminoacyl peptidase